VIYHLEAKLPIGKISMTQRSGLNASLMSALISSSVNMTVLLFAACSELLYQAIKLLLQ
jgi:hypothetical protein